MAEVHEVTDANFEAEVLQSDRPVLVDFWAEWCAPCRAIAPIVKELAAEHEGKLKVVKVDVDQSPQAAAKFGVRSIPTVLAFQNGTVAGQLNGARPKSAFQELVQKVL